MYDSIGLLSMCVIYIIVIDLTDALNCVYVHVQYHTVHIHVYTNPTGVKLIIKNLPTV